jgi:chemotaxis protein CheD
VSVGIFQTRMRKNLLNENNIIDVDTGEIKIGTGDVTLRSSTIGSCVVIAGYGLKEKVGVLAHVMVPGKAPGASPNTKYAIDAIDKMISLMARRGMQNGDFEVCLAGGANVLKDNDDTICRNNINSVKDYLGRKKIKIKAESLGGTERRSVAFDVAAGDIRYTEGDGDEKLLWKVGRYDEGKRKKG